EFRGPGAAEGAVPRQAAFDDEVLAVVGAEDRERADIRRGFRVVEPAVDSNLEVAADDPDVDLVPEPVVAVRLKAHVKHEGGAPGLLVDPAGVGRNPGAESALPELGLGLAGHPDPLTP